MFKKFITKDNPLFTLSFFFGLCLLLIGSSSFELSLGLGVFDDSCLVFLSNLVLKLVEPLIIDSLKALFT